MSSRVDRYERDDLEARAAQSGEEMNADSAKPEATDPDFTDTSAEAGVPFDDDDDEERHMAKPDLDKGLPPTFGDLSRMADTVEASLASLKATLAHGAPVSSGSHGWQAHTMPPRSPADAPRTVGRDHLEQKPASGLSGGETDSMVQNLPPTQQAGHGVTVEMLSLRAAAGSYSGRGPIGDAIQAHEAAGRAVQASHQLPSSHTAAYPAAHASLTRRAPGE